MRKSQKSEKKSEQKKSGLIALKDFKIVHNEHCIEIKEGDDLSRVPEMFLQNLRTEGVLKSAPKQAKEE